MTLSLYYEQIGKNYRRISKVKHYTNNFNWENINFPPQEKDYKTLEMNNNSIALNVLQKVERKISHLCKSEFNKTRQKTKKNQGLKKIIKQNIVNHFHNQSLNQFHNRQ